MGGGVDAGYGRRGGVGCVVVGERAFVEGRSWSGSVDNRILALPQRHQDGRVSIRGYV